MTTESQEVENEWRRPRIPTGVAALDAVIWGGFSHSQVGVIAVAPGASLTVWKVARSVETRAKTVTGRQIGHIRSRSMPESATETKLGRQAWVIDQIRRCPEIETWIIDSLGSILIGTSDEDREDRDDLARSLHRTALSCGRTILVMAGLSAIKVSRQDDSLSRLICPEDLIGVASQIVYIDEMSNGESWICRFISIKDRFAPDGMCKYSDEYSIS